MSFAVPAFSASQLKEIIFMSFNVDRSATLIKWNMTLSPIPFDQSTLEVAI